MTPLDVALEHASQGRRIHPVDPDTKRPAWDGWPDRATWDADVLRDWWSRHPQHVAAWALPADVAVVDADPRNGADPGAPPGPLPLTRTTTTPGAGAHFFYAVPPDRPVKNGEIVKGWDCKTGGGYVLLDGVVRPDGKAYTLARDLPLAPAPEWLLAAKARNAGPAAEALPAGEVPVIWTAGAAHETVMTPALVALLTPGYAEGGRHAKARAIGAVLALAGWSLDAIAGVVGQLPSDRSEARVEQALDAARRAHDGAAVPQHKALAAAFGARIAGHVAELAKQPVVAELESLAKTIAATPAYKVLKIGNVSAPIPPVNWLCERLRIAPGAPTIVAGYGGLGKSMLVQLLIVCSVVGKPCMAAPVRQGRVLHLDYEQGPYETESRYKRLAAEIGLRAGELHDGLDVLSPPPFNLVQDGAEAVLTDLCRHYDLLVIDSLRAATPGLDENGSEIRAPLDMLFRVSVATGCTIVVIHHARKATRDNGDAGGQNMRGNSAINDAAQAVVMLEPTTHGFRIKPGKVRIGKKFDPIDVEIEDTDVPGVPFQGLRLNVTDGNARDAAAANDQLARDAHDVLGYLNRQPAGRFKGGVKLMCTALALTGIDIPRDTRLPAALEVLQARRQIDHNRGVYYVTPGTPGVTLGSDGVPKATT